MTDVRARAVVPGRVLRLWSELAALFVATPLVLAFWVPVTYLWVGLVGLVAVSILLLSVSDGFAWRSLLARPAVPDGAALALFVAATALVATGLVLWLRPYALFALPRYNRELWLLIVCFYPFLSALPQEIVFRALFFTRYGSLFPGRRAAIAANAAAFSLAHLFYWNWPAVVLTAFGGAIFAWAYREKESFLFAWLLHALAGQIVFTSGLGVFFYHGAIVRP